MAMEKRDYRALSLSRSPYDLPSGKAQPCVNSKLLTAQFLFLRGSRGEQLGFIVCRCGGLAVGFARKKGFGMGPH